MGILNVNAGCRNIQEFFVCRTVRAGRGGVCKRWCINRQRGLLKKEVPAVCFICYGRICFPVRQRVP